MGWVSDRSTVGTAWLVVCLSAAIACAAPAPRPAGDAQPAASGPAPVASASGQEATSAAGKVAWEQEWDKVVAAARREGKLSINVPPGQQYEPALREAFGKAFPGIEIELINLLGGQFRVRVEKERAADQYAWDACICGPGVDTYRLIKDGVFDPIMDDLMLPEVLDDSKWLGGIGARFSDEAKKYAFDFGATNTVGGVYNRDLIADPALTKYEDLWKPEFRGKIVWFDPRGTGSGTNAAAIVLHVYGEEKLRELWTTQQIQLSNDDRQMAQWVIRGVRPIAIGMVYNRGIMPLQQEGVPMNIGNFPYPVPLAIPGPHSLQAVNRPPHPNARKLFVNWLLTREGQTVLAQAIATNSARLDVPIFSPDEEVPRGVPTLNTQSEAFADTRTRAGAIGREIFK